MNKTILAALAMTCSITLMSSVPCVAAESTATATVAVQPSTSNTVAASIAPPPAPGKWENFWIDRVRQFIAENAGLDPAARNIVFVGDSLTQGFKVKEFFPDLPVLNRGIVSDGGCDFPEGRSIYRGVTHRMKESIYDCRPSHLIYLIGTNDVGVTNIPLDYWFGAYKYVIQQTQKQFPDVKIILVTCPPCGAPYKKIATLNPRLKEWNTIIRDYAKKEGFRLIDLYELLADKDGQLPADLTTDGLHFNKKGYDRWADALRTILQQDGVTAAKPAEQ